MQPFVSSGRVLSHVDSICRMQPFVSSGRVLSHVDSSRRRNFLIFDRASLVSGLREKRTTFLGGIEMSHRSQSLLRSCRKSVLVFAFQRRAIGSKTFVA